MLQLSAGWPTDNAFESRIGKTHLILSELRHIQASSPGVLAIDPIDQSIYGQHGRLHGAKREGTGSAVSRGTVMWKEKSARKDRYVVLSDESRNALDCTLCVFWWFRTFLLKMAKRLTALVTGGASGLGRATALQLARRGMGVVVADVRNATPFEEENIRYAETDVSSESDSDYMMIALLCSYRFGYGCTATSSRVSASLLHAFFLVRAALLLPTVGYVAVAVEVCIL